MGSVEPVQMNICQSNTYREYLSWLYFDNEPGVPGRQQVKDQQSHISVFVVSLTSPRSTCVDIATVFHARLYGRFGDTEQTQEKETSQNK